MKTQPIEEFLALRREAGMSKQTSNHYRQAMHQFCRWLHRRSLLRHNPIAEIPKLNVDTDRRHDRRALSTDEFHRLLAAAEVGKPVEKLPGVDRAMMYILSAWTGYRRGEIGSLTLTSLQLDSDPPTVTVEAMHSKRRRKDVQVLHPEVVARFRDWLTKRKPLHDRYLFPLTKEACGFERKTAKMMQRDLDAARESWINEARTPEERQTREKSDYLCYCNAAGLFADFHANRHTFITNLARAGVSPKVAQTLARHSDIRLTMNTYTHTDLNDQVQAVSMLPGLGSYIVVSTPPAAAMPEPEQRYSSATVAEIDAQRQSVANEAANRKRSRVRERRCKPLQQQGLAEEASGCQPVSEVHPNGFEPLTFGSVG